MAGCETSGKLYNPIISSAAGIEPSVAEFSVFGQRGKSARTEPDDITFSIFEFLKPGQVFRIGVPGPAHNQNIVGFLSIGPVGFPATVETDVNNLAAASPEFLF